MPFFCVANGDGDFENDCCLDNNRPDQCYLPNRPERKEDCEYWEEHNQPLNPTDAG